ncbi:rod shape-determining protein RodA [Tindallia californiensis]|uniref:Peptidoglycan glycosyltransferase RodA n=1 Tax=Tindallia californiensis TaxID=159292 RepID=A0A1H3JX93_9FIRM|nr:rod shape-determining protein RodA [Tindallia californiensis]SDY43884.1 rod shape determining protein RodA [Tindallia californiensis]
MINDSKLLKKIDFTLVVIVLLICAYGVVIISSSTLNHRLGAPHFVRSQIKSVAIGLMAMCFMLSINYKTLKRLALPIYLISNALLLMVLIIGVGQEDWGASRWIRIGGIGFQPADFVKIGLIICLAKIVDDQKEYINQPATLFKILGFMFAPLVLIMLQPDLGTTLVLGAIIFGVLFIAGLRYKYILMGAVLGLFTMPIFWNLLEDYQRTRILIFLNPEMDPMGAGYQIIQSKRAVGAGMLRGQGLYSGTQSQYGFLPERHTDFVFSVIAEELGFIGASVLLFLFIAMLVKCIYIAMNAKDDFGMFLVVGVIFMLAFHIFINVGMAIGLMPVTGKPLPFISHGGTFMLTNFMAIGLVLNVYMRRDVINF